MAYYYESPIATIEWLDDIKCVLTIWKGFSKGEQQRQIAEKALSLAISKKTHKWLADAKELGMLTPEDQTWWEKVMLPKMARNGIRYNIVVMPKSALAGISIKTVVTRLGNIELVSQYFDDVNEAKSWLANK